MSNELINYLVNYAIKGLIVLCFFGFRSIRRRNIESSGAIGGQKLILLIFFFQFTIKVLKHL